ncbi:hypothetical protein [Ponticaulis sp.]|uniref:hypothetical protein n=1 Tax=Ponticaulis sp. TaxID=2020902 RepID=UPI000B68E570|nr:hypothetical protein [Ponticaulis sp.]MAJ09505.1 hypothetical protein [Ponticaulis sp.]RPG18849.1 MAG: hypothetical protein CBC85_001025 [Hyphomonadaceae bacterium TMED125]HBH88673.1 hypothetical protein [Hyphomonadaceae bacterium]HBJ94886.1 hypothetical protein [Hyphomonadaceae bacterium]|tara:strand:+ start:224 stop:550 length:327 start_codon:yes stop_codon:yes gene_type:complete
MSVEDLMFFREGDRLLSKNPVQFSEVSAVNEAGLSFPARRNRILKQFKHFVASRRERAVIPLEWLTHDAKIAVQSLVDSDLLSYLEMNDGSDRVAVKLTGKGRSAVKR